WLQPILCFPALEWHARKISSQPENDANEEHYIKSGVASVVNSDGRGLTCGYGLCFVNKACYVIQQLFPLVFGYSTPVLNEDILDHVGLSQYSDIFFLNSH
uniref:Peptidase A1 domain-containing protein n=1 Tax=Mesocestoides corti TaxID=53468 RepID=A0A5K3FFR2_MESCO